MALNIGTKKIADLTEATELESTDLFIVQSGEDTKKVTKQNAIDKQHTQFLHTFASSSFVAATRTGWDDWFVSVKNNVKVYNKSGSVRAAGASLDVPPTDDMVSQVSGMQFYVTDEGTSVEAYAKSVPAADVVVSIEGVQ